MNNNIYIIVALFLASYTNIYSQNGCGAAVGLTPGSQQCGSSVGIAGDFPSGGGAPTNPCNGSYNDDEYWFSYTGNGVNGLQLDLSALSDLYAGLFVLDACPATAGCVASATNGFSSADLSVSTPVLTNGQTYYIVIASWGTPDNTSFC